MEEEGTRRGGCNYKRVIALNSTCFIGSGAFGLLVGL